MADSSVWEARSARDVGQASIRSPSGRDALDSMDSWGKEKPLGLHSERSLLPLDFRRGLFGASRHAGLVFQRSFLVGEPRNIKKDGTKELIFVALAIAGMFYSKYHSIVIVLLTAFSMPEIFKRRSFYKIIALSALLYLPHVWWQYKHDFLSIVFHLTGRSEKHFDLSNIANFVTGQIALGGLLALRRPYISHLKAGPKTNCFI